MRMISFTGSTATGRKVGEAAGRNLKRVVLELGGNSPLVVLEDADIEAASSAGAWGSFLHQGQICLAVSRHLVHESIADDYVKALAERASHLPVGNPATEEVALGPIINEKQVQRVARIVDESVSQGANLVTGGTHENLFFQPTVLGDVTSSMPAFTDEIFGPVAPVITFKDDAEAVELANATDYGLVAAVQSGSQRRAAAVGEQLHAGMVHVNDTTINEEPVLRSAASARRATAATSAASRTSSCGPSGSGRPRATRPSRSRSRAWHERRHAVIDVDRVVAIDLHTHAEVARDGHDPMPPELRQAAERYFRGQVDRPTADDVAAYYRERDMACVVFTVDYETRSGRAPVPNEEVAEAAAANPDVMIPFASVDPARQDAAERARRLIADHDVRGFKFHPNIQAFFPNDRMAYPLYEVIAEARPARALPHRPQRHRLGRAGRRRAAAQVLAADLRGRRGGRLPGDADRARAPVVPVAGRGALDRDAQAGGVHRPVGLVAEVLPAPAGPVRQHAAQEPGALRLGLPDDQAGALAEGLRAARHRRRGAAARSSRRMRLACSTSGGSQ